MAERRVIPSDGVVSRQASRAGPTRRHGSADVAPHSSSRRQASQPGGGSVPRPPRRDGWGGPTIPAESWAQNSPYDRALERERVSQRSEMRGDTDSDMNHPSHARHGGNREALLARAGSRSRSRTWRPDVPVYGRPQLLMRRAGSRGRGEVRAGGREAVVPAQSGARSEVRHDSDSQLDMGQARPAHPGRVRPSRAAPDDRRADTSPVTRVALPADG